MQLCRWEIVWSVRSGCPVLVGDNVWILTEPVLLNSVPVEEAAKRSQAWAERKHNPERMHAYCMTCEVPKAS